MRRQTRVRVRDNDSGREFEDSYDALMIAGLHDSVAPKVPERICLRCSI